MIHSLSIASITFQLTRPMRGVTKMMFGHFHDGKFQLTRPMRGVTNGVQDWANILRFQLTRPMRGVTRWYP